MTNIIGWDYKVKFTYIQGIRVSTLIEGLGRAIDIED
jgi:hypothetical protein